jgi:hypothetical protein
MKQTSAIERLQSLPPVFRGADLTIRFQWESKTASQYLYLWKRRGLVEGLGGHSDVFANLLADRRPNWGKALLMAMPSAVVVGIDALRQAMWTTQEPNRPVVAVNSQHSMFTTEYFEIQPRDPKWFELVLNGITKNDKEGPRVLSPAWALADLLRESEWGTFGLDPDDIEWDEVSRRDEKQWEAACKAFGLPKTKLMSFVEYSR